MSTAAGISPDFLEISLSRYETGEIEVAPEIVSPSQDPRELFSKCEAYYAWGVPFCCVIGPVKQAAWRYHAGTPLDRVANGLHAGEIAVVLDELFEHK